MKENIEMNNLLLGMLLVIGSIIYQAIRWYFFGQISLGYFPFFFILGISIMFIKNSDKEYWDCEYCGKQFVDKKIALEHEKNCNKNKKANKNRMDEEHCTYCAKNYNGYLDKYLCNYCNNYFCSEHRLPENHNCKNKLNSVSKSHREIYSRGNSFVSGK